MAFRTSHGLRRTARILAGLGAKRVEDKNSYMSFMQERGDVVALPPKRSRAIYWPYQGNEALDIYIWYIYIYIYIMKSKKSGQNGILKLRPFRKQKARSRWMAGQATSTIPPGRCCSTTRRRRFQNGTYLKELSWIHRSQSQRRPLQLNLWEKESGRRKTFMANSTSRGLPVRWR